MPKSRPNKKQERRLYQRHAYSVATEVRLLAQQLRNQQQLDTLLLQEPDVSKRIKLFDFMKPFIKFSDPQLPSTIERPRIILP